MSEAPVSSLVALRIGLAARALPGVSAGALIDALHECLGEPIDEAALNKVTVTALKTAFGKTYDTDGEEDGAEQIRSSDIASFKEAVRILWGDASDVAPVIDDSGAEASASVQVAVASNAGEQLDGHFGSCLRFLVFRVSIDSIALVDVRSTEEADASGDKNSSRVDLIRDCCALYVVSIGGPAAAKVIKADIHIIPHSRGGAAREVLLELQRKISSSPPPWLAKRLGVDPRERVRNYRGE